jgi:murein DD-endopeptidase MepM/ murein hydrolase activator NlpD
MRAWIGFAGLATAAAVLPIGLAVHAVFLSRTSDRTIPVSRLAAARHAPAGRPAAGPVARPKPKGVYQEWLELTGPPEPPVRLAYQQRHSTRRVQLRSRGTGFRPIRRRAPETGRSLWPERMHHTQPPDDEGSSSVGLIIPVAGVGPGSLSDSFSAARSGGRRHRAIDIGAPRGTPVVAAVDGVIKRIGWNGLGGLGITQIDRDGHYSFYYAHLDAVVEGLYEGMTIHQGDPIGYVGTTGNAPPNFPHLHFAISRITSKDHWWGGSAVNPYPLLVEGVRP